MAFALNTISRISKIRLLVVVVTTCVVVYGIVFASRGLFMQDQNGSIDEEIRVTTQAVGKLMELPAEKPTVATVKDVTQLPANQPFFRVAKNGDKVLFYNDAKKAILYRPSTDKIVNIAPITINPELLK